MAGPLTLDDFRAQVGTTFSVGTAQRALFDARLASVEPLAPAGDGFSLTFHGPADPAYEQATFRLEHPLMGPLDVFLVPIRRDAAGTIYEAIFN